MPLSQTDKLIAWMQRQGLKQVDLARQMEISESTVSLILNGHRAPSDSFAGRFAKTYCHDDFVEVFGANGQPAATEVPA